MDSYIIRIYHRRTTEMETELTGVVEIFPTGRHIPFMRMEELWKILAEETSGPGNTNPEIS